VSFTAASAVSTRSSTGPSSSPSLSAPARHANSSSSSTEGFIFAGAVANRDTTGSSPACEPSAAAADGGSVTAAAAAPSEAAAAELAPSLALESGVGGAMPSPATCDARAAATASMPACSAPVICSAANFTWRPTASGVVADAVDLTDGGV